MSIFKYLLGLWTAIAVYTFFSFISGSTGLAAYNYLLSEREQQWSNIRELGVIHEELEKTRNNLLYDYDTVLVHARILGYGYDDERFLRIVGLGTQKITPAVAGSVYSVQKPGFLSDRSIKIAALCLGLMVFAFFFMLEFIESRVR